MKTNTAWLLFALALLVVFAAGMVLAFSVGFMTGFSFTLLTLKMSLADFLAKAATLRGG